MRRDFTQPILNLDGTPGKVGDEPITLQTLAMSALNTITEEDRTLTGSERAKRFDIMQRIYARPREVDLTAEQITLLKNLIGKMFAPLAVGRAYELLEQEPKAVSEGAA
jgi:hypothetical protein